MIDTDDAEQVNQALELVNSQEYEVMQLHRFKYQNAHGQHLSVNETCTKFLLTSSDRTLRLYELDFDLLLQQKKALFLLNEFTDVINKRKWMNTCFFKLQPNQRLEQKGQAIGGITGYQ